MSVQNPEIEGRETGARIEPVGEERGVFEAIRNALNGIRGRLGSAAAAGVVMLSSGLARDARAEEPPPAAPVAAAADADGASRSGVVGEPAVDANGASRSGVVPAPPAGPASGPDPATGIVGGAEPATGEVAPNPTGVPSPATAITAPAQAPVAESCGEVPCYLTQAHFKYLEAQIAEARAQVEDLRAALTRARTFESQQIAVPTMAVADKTAVVAHREIIEIQLKQANEKLEALKSQFVEALARMNRDKIVPPWAGWYGGVDLRAQNQLGTGPAAPFAPLTAEVYARWVAENHLGLEAGVGGGAWLTRNEVGRVFAPPMISGRVAGVASWEHLGLAVGPRLSVLGAPRKDQPAITTAGIDVEGEFKAGGFRLAAGVNVPVEAPYARFGGVGPFVTLGYQK